MQISFIDKGGATLTGNSIIIPGFEKLDLVCTEDGFLKRIYELATGLELMQSQSFTEKDVIADALKGFSNKNLSDVAILKKIYANDYHQFGNKTLKVINHSPSFLAFKQATEEELANRPFAFNEAERAEIIEMIDIAIAENLPILAVLQGHLNKKADKFRPATIQGIRDTFKTARLRHHAKLIRWSGQIMPDHLRSSDYTTREDSYSAMIDEFNTFRKRDITKHLPTSLLQEFYKLWALCATKNNEYGYARFCPNPISDVIRLAIDLKKGRDMQDKIIEICKVIAETFEDVISGSQPYIKQAHEI